jgi:TolA-binding protein
MIYNQQGNYTKAIAAYKQLISDYPHSQEAQIAAQDLKNIYIELGKIDEYAAFAPMESSERDTLTYVAAERIYSRQKYDEAREALKRYLQEFPNGSFVLDSHYYLGLIYYNQKAPNDALVHFEKVIAFPDNKYSEEAMAISSELYYQERNYKKASDLFRLLASKTDNETRRRTCRMNIMRCEYLLGNNPAVIESATTLLADGSLSPEWEREVHYTRAKAFIASDNAEKAVADLTKLAKDTRSKQGAEAKYLLAQHYYNKKDYKKCEAEIFDYIEMGTNHSYWMARSFILLTDLYIAENRILEAKQYLLTLQNNYEGKDDIEQMIKERLDKINNSNNE